MTPSDLARIIDHTVLGPDVVRTDVLRLCREAREYGFGAVCVAPAWLSAAREALDGAATRIVTVVGFPHGDTLSAAKVREAELSLEAGANELDMVVSIGHLKSGDRKAVAGDIAGVVAAARRVRGTVVKVILEAPLLTREEKILGCRLAEEAGADFVKTCTGFAGGGATVEDVALFREVVGGRLGVKAAGGIRDARTALAMVEAGASRIGTSSSVAIVDDRVRTRRGTEDAG